jgi:hypothetical protein
MFAGTRGAETPPVWRCESPEPDVPKPQGNRVLHVTQHSPTRTQPWPPGATTTRASSLPSAQAFTYQNFSVSRHDKHTSSTHSSTPGLGPHHPLRDGEGYPRPPFAICRYLEEVAGILSNTTHFSGDGCLPVAGAVCRHPHAQGPAVA